MPGNGDPAAEAEVGETGSQKLSDVKSSSKIVQKKMVQARLPFKRLNPVPHEDEVMLQGKKQKVTQRISSADTVSPVDLLVEDVENGCKMETEDMQLLPKIINGRGPLDNYVRKVSKACHGVPSVTIDLTEDSNSGCDHPVAIEKVQTNLANGPVHTDCDSVRSQTVTETDKVINVDGIEQSDEDPRHSVPTPEISDIRKESQSTVPCDHRHNVSVHDSAEMNEEPSHSSEELSVVPADSDVCTSPLRTIADIAVIHIEGGSTPPSSSGSPSSSPEASTGTLLKRLDESATGIDKASACQSRSEKQKIKEKEQDIKRRKLQAEKEERDRLKEELKLAKERAKEEAKKKKDEEREQRAKEKKEKKEKDDREKAEKLRLKEEKKKEKLEALEAKQEEKRKREEEKRIKEEEKRMKAEKAEITRFLQKSKTFHTPKLFAQSCGKFAPFEIKKNMAIAPLCRVEFELESSEQLDKFLKEQNSEIHFLLELKARKPRKMGRTKIAEVLPLASDCEEVHIIMETESDAALQGKVVHDCTVPERKRFGKMKLLQFSENHRPAYWGTWNRSSTIICPRKPWKQDTALLDYEIDSDDEWEEEEPGESLSHSEGEDDEDDTKEEDDDDDDDGFFVPHGYLSEDEGGVSDEECKNLENQKVRQRLKAKEWDELQSKGNKIHVLKPIVIGCTWFGGSSAEIPFLQKFSACILDTVIPIEEDLVQENARSFKDREILMHLLPLLHGNVNGSKIIIQEFQECCKRGLISLAECANVSVTESTSPNSRHLTPSSFNVPSKARLKRIISENSVYEKRPEHRMCWYVHTDVLRSFQQESLPVPCQWTYVTQVNLTSKDETGNSGGLVQGTLTSGKRKSAGSMPITKFMKKATELGSGSGVGASEPDGFQADTEEEDDEEDEDICIIVEEQDKKDTDVSSILCKMEVTLSKESTTA